MSQALRTAPAPRISAEPADNGALMSFIERASRDDAFSVEKFGELLRLRREMEHDSARRAFNAAMAETQAEMEPVVRTSENTHLRNRYAKLEDIDRAMRPIYTRHGFSVRFGSAPSPTEGNVRIVCTVAHSGGYYEENHLDSPFSLVGSQGGKMAVTPVQAVGSVVTYLRRYLLAMCFNVVLADDDDDGEGQRRASTRTSPPPRPAAAPESNSNGAQRPYESVVWLDNLAKKLATADRDAVVKIGGLASVTEALRDGPDRVKEVVGELLADAYQRTEPEVYQDGDAEIPFGDTEASDEAPEDRDAALAAERVAEIEACRDPRAVDKLMGSMTMTGTLVKLEKARPDLARQILTASEEKLGELRLGGG